MIFTSINKHIWRSNMKGRASRWPVRCRRPQPDTVCWCPAYTSRTAPDPGGCPPTARSQRHTERNTFSLGGTEEDPLGSAVENPLCSQTLSTTWSFAASLRCCRCCERPISRCLRLFCDQEDFFVLPRQKNSCPTYFRAPQNFTAAFLNQLLFLWLHKLGNGDSVVETCLSGRLEQPRRSADLLRSSSRVANECELHMSSKGPTLYPFSDVSSQTPVEQTGTILQTSRKQHL